MTAADQPTTEREKTYVPCGNDGYDFVADCGWCWVLRDQPTTEPTSITVPRPHVTHGPEHVTASQADAAYLRGAVLNIEHQNRGERLWGSGVTAMVSKLLNDAADALLAPAPQPAADTERDERVREIIARADCVPPGPWFSWASLDSDGNYAYGVSPDRDLEENLFETPPTPLGSAVCDFVADARTDVPWLLSEVDRLSAVVNAQAATIARLHEVGTGVVAHRYEGDCPVGPPFSPTKRDPACPACRALDGGAR